MAKLPSMSVAIATCVALAAPLIAVSALASQPAHDTFPVQAFLCDSADHAIAFADVLAIGEGEEMARDRVGRIAKAEVCGRYAGVATIESESVTLKGGIAYKITAYRFVEDKKLAWLAEMSFAPPKATWDL